MPLTLITGRANSGKTGLALDAFRSSRNGGGEPILVVPSGPDVGRVSTELAAEYASGVRVVRFDGLIEHLWQLHGDHRTIVTPTQRRALLLGQRRADGVGSSGSFVDLVGRVIEHAAPSGSGWRDLAPVSGDAADVAESVRAYALELTRRELIEPGEAGHIAARSLGAGDAIIFHRFDDLTDAQTSFVEAASATAADVYASVTWEEGFVPTEAMDPLVERLRRQGTVVSADAGDAHTHAELRRVGTELFQEPEARAESSALRFIASEGPQAEMDHIAGHAARLIESGIPPERIAVVWRDLAPVHEMARRALQEAGVGADIDVVVPFSETPFGRAFADVVDFLGSGSREPLLACLRSGYLCAEDARALELASAWLRDGIVDVSRLLADVTALGSWRKTLPGLASGAAWGDDHPAPCWDALAGHMIGERHGGGSLHDGHLDEDSHVRAALTRLLRDCQELQGIPLDARSLGALLEGHVVAPRVVERPGHVQVTSAERVRGRRFDAVLVGGLNAGVFPALREDVLHAEALQPVFEAAGATPPRPGGALAERALLYGVVTRARSALLLSRRLTDAGGDPEGPSVFWEELRDFVRVPGSDAEAGEPILTAAETGLAAHATSSLRGPAREAARAICSAQDVCDAPRRLALAHARSRSAAGDGGPAAVGSEFADRSVFSAGELETYARCPYQWFLQRGVRGQALELGVDATVKGSVAHDALLRVYTFAEGENRATFPPAVQEIEPIAREAVDEAVAASGIGPREGRSLVAEVTPRVARSLAADAEAFPGFAPRWLEWSFGDGEELEVALGPHRLKGRIDRVDVRGGEGLVIDYKWGRVGEYTRAKLAETPTIQALLYAHAASTVLELDVVGAVYRGLGDGATRGALVGEQAEGFSVVKTDLISREEMAELVGRAVDIGVAAAEGVRAGRIDRTGGDHCAWCPVAGWCGEYVS